MAEPEQLEEHSPQPALVVECPETEPFMQPALIATEGSLQSGNGAGEGASPSEDEGKERTKSALLVPQQQRSKLEEFLRGAEEMQGALPTLADLNKELLQSLKFPDSAYADYSNAVKLGEVLVTYGKVMMIGPGGAGKSSLLCGLKNERLPENAESTLLVNTSSVKYGWAKAGRHSTQPWTNLGEEDEIHELACYLSRALASKSLLSSAESAHAIGVFRPTDVMEVMSHSSKYDGRHKAHVDAVLKRARKSLLESSQRKVEVLLYVWDSGGQLVFLDVLPAFLTSRALFFLVYNSAEDLSQRFPVVTRCKGKIIKSEKHYLSTLETLLQWMASIHAHLGRLDDKGRMRPFPKVLLVGTHRDLLSSPLDAETAIIQSLQSQYSGKRYRDVLMPSPYYFVDNTKAGKGDCEDETYKKLRQCVHDFASDKLTVRTPISWVLFRKVVHMISQENEEAIMTYEDALTIADACSIPAEALPSVLNFYHELGVVLYYAHIAPLQQIVIVNPQWLVSEFAKLLSPHGFEDEGRENLWCLVRNKGIMVGELYNEVLSGSRMEPQQFLELLEHFHLAVGITTKDVHSYKGREYFIPSMLCTPPLSSPAVDPTSDVEPLHVAFATNYVPPGFFVRLISAVASKPHYTIIFKNINRYRVDFALEDRRPQQLTVSESPCSISLTLSNFTDCDSPHDTCQEVLDILPGCLDSVSQWLPGVKANMAFKCSNCPHSQHFVLFDPTASNVSHKYLRCQQEETYPPSSKQLPWFQQGEADARPKRVCPSELSSAEFDRVTTSRVAAEIECGAAADMFQPLSEQYQEATMQSPGEVSQTKEALGPKAGHPSDSIFEKFPECKNIPPLGIDDLQYVLRILHDKKLVAKWLAIGQTLTVTDDDLDRFKAEFKNDPDLCLLQVMAAWLQGQARRCEDPSWSRVVRMIADERGGDKRRAGLEVARKLKALSDRGELSKFIPTTTLAKDTPQTPLLEDIESDSSSVHVYESAEDATSALRTELLPVAHRWLHIGLLLGIKFSWLEQTRSKGNDDKQNLRDMLTHWLNSLGDVTLPRLVEAVEHSAGGKNPRLARDKLVGLAAM